MLVGNCELSVVLNAATSTREINSSSSSIRLKGAGLRAITGTLKMVVLMMIFTPPPATSPILFTETFRDQEGADEGFTKERNERHKAILTQTIDSANISSVIKSNKTIHDPKIQVMNMPLSGLLKSPDKCLLLLPGQLNFAKVSINRKISLNSSTTPF